MALTIAQQVLLEQKRIIAALGGIGQVANELVAAKDINGLIELRAQLFKSRHLQAAILAN